MIRKTKTTKIPANSKNGSTRWWVSRTLNRIRKSPNFQHIGRFHKTIAQKNLSTDKMVALQMLSSI